MNKDRRAAKVGVWAVLIGAGKIGITRPPATGHENVISNLAAPAELARVQIERDDSIGQGLRRPAETVSRGDVDRAASGIDDRRRPAASPRRPKKTPACSVCLKNRQGPADHGGLPDSRAGPGVECRQTSAKGAAVIIAAGRHALLEGSTGNIKPVLVENR